VSARPIGVLAEPNTALEMAKDPAVEKAAGRALAFDFFAAIDGVTPS
jgi:hypothetical protein